MSKTRLASSLDGIAQKYENTNNLSGDTKTLEELRNTLSNRGYSHSARVDRAKELISSSGLSAEFLSQADYLLSAYDSYVRSSKKIKNNDSVAYSVLSLKSEVQIKYIDLETAVNNSSSVSSPASVSDLSKRSTPKNPTSPISINPYLMESIQQDTQSEEPSLAVPAEMRRRTGHSHSKRIRKTPREGADLNSVQLSDSSDILSFYESNFSSSIYNITGSKNATFSSPDIQERVYNDNISLENTLAEQISSDVSSLISVYSSPSASVPSVPASPSVSAGVIDLSEDSPPPISITPYLPESINRRRTGLIRKEIIAGLVGLAIGAVGGALGGYGLGSWVGSRAQNTEQKEHNIGREDGRIEGQNDEYLGGKDTGFAEWEKSVRDKIAEENSILAEKVLQERKVSDEIISFTSHLGNFSNAFPLTNVQIQEDGRTTISGRTSYSNLTLVDSPKSLAELANAVAASFHPKEVDANAFENLGLSRTAMGEIRKYAPEESLDEFGMVVSGLSSGRGYVPYENNSKGVSLIGNSQSIEQRLAQAPQNHEKAQNKEVKKKERKKVKFISRLLGGRVRFVRAR